MRIAAMKAGALALIGPLGILSGCGLLGGPDPADIEAVARVQMTAGLPAMIPAAVRTALVDAVARARIRPKGLCSTPTRPQGAYACGVEVTSTPPGSAAPMTQQFVVVMRKGADGGWTAAE